MVLIGGACAGGTDDSSPVFPDVVEATIVEEDGGTYRFDVTISSPYDSADRYADAWRVTGPGGEVYAVRILTHPHADEQPFTRSLGAVVIPADVHTVTVQARDLLNQWGGSTVDVAVP